VYVSIKEVRIHQSSTASEDDTGWVQLTPENFVPVQVDILADGDANCFLATLGTDITIPAGSYQQIRLILVPDNERNTITGTNNCAGVNTANCLVIDSTGEVHALELSSQDRTGIKIPSGQIAGGQFVVAAGEQTDLDIDLNGCASIVLTGNGRFRLKPVLHAGEISLQDSLSGRVVNNVDGTTINGTIVVALEQRDSNNVARVVRQTLADALGSFVICPVPAGTYDLVVTAIGTDGKQWAPTIITGITTIGNLGNVPLFLQPGVNTGPAAINGEVTTEGSSGAVSADVQVIALQPADVSGTSVWFTIPLAEQSATSVQLATASGSCSSASVACADYQLKVPAAKPVLIAAGSGATPSQDTTQPVPYRVEASAFLVGGGNVPNCTDPTMETDTLSGGGTLQVNGNDSVTATTITFTGCQ
jgi:hypothetical protein